MTAGFSATKSFGTWGAPLRFGHQGGWASNRLDQGVDLQASPTKFGSASD